VIGSAASPRRLAAWRKATNMAGQQGADPIYTQADWSGLGSGIGSIFSRLLGGVAPVQTPQAEPAQAPGPQPVAIMPRALQQAPLPPARPPLATAPLPPARPADLGQASPAQQVTLPQFDVTAAPMPSRPVTPTPSPNAAPLAAAASIPVQLPPASPAGTARRGGKFLSLVSTRTRIGMRWTTFTQLPLEF
jgi:hypothetical protein